MPEQSEPQGSGNASDMAKKRLIRGAIAIVASAVIALLIRTGIAEPHPDLIWAYICCVAVGLWGLIEIIRGALGLKRLE